MAEAVSHLVVVGASAGGVEALSTLVSTLSPAFPAPIVVAQHLDPSRTSHLHEILARKSNLPVRSVQDEERLEPGVVYIVPADRHVDIADHMVSVHAEAGHTRPSPSIDRLLGSAAEAFGERVVAVILTGLGSDGSDGARRVKELGGTVVIQNPQTASHPEMPLSLAPTTVDVVAELEAIGPLLTQLVADTYAPVRPDDERRLRSLLDQVRARSGIDFSAYREPTIRRRLQRRMLDTGSETLEDYIRFLRRRPEEYERLANSFLIKVTDFFRDADLFGYLRDHVLRALIDDARTRGNELRLWSAGCATGEEAYSLAILVSELLGPELDQFTVRIFATDLDAEAIAFARRGVYPASAVKHLPAGLRDRFLNRVDGAFEVGKQARALVLFGQHDLGQRAPFPRIDLVLCRNVLIYFTPELQRRSLELFAFALREGGTLVLGKSEGTSPLPEYFALTNARLRVFRRHGERLLIPVTRLRDATPLHSSVLGGRPVLTDRPHARARQTGAHSPAESADQILLDLPVGVVVVDRHYDILLINATARRLLGIHAPAIGEDVVHLAYRPLGTPLRDAIDAAVNGQDARAVHEITSLPDTPGETRYFELSSMVRRPTSERTGANDAVVVLVSDITAGERERRERALFVAESDARAAHLQDLLDESTRTVRQLLAANQELATTNANLRSSTEELQLGTEEAEAAMDEIETLNEEQQATNEELETLNEELQASVEELNATNEDLQARSVQLQEHATEREALLATLTEERTRLAAILASMSDAVVMVDAAGDPVLTNNAFQRMFGEGLPPLEDGSGHRLPSRTSPQRLAARGETFTHHFTVPSADGSRLWFEASGQPIRTGERVAGGVVVIRDVSDRSVRQLQERFVAVAGHELRTPLTALTGSLQLLDRALHDEGEPDGRLVRYVTIGLQQARLLADLVQDLSDVVRLQRGQLVIERSPINLVELVQTTVELVRPMAGAQHVIVEAPAEPLMVDGDRRRLQQVVLNLVANAMQHGSSPGGITIRLSVDAGDVVLLVRDYGPGIPADERERVFERFHQVGRGGGPGLGVGLFLVQAIVAAHSGAVRVESPEGGGAAFVVRVPRLETAP